MKYWLVAIFLGGLSGCAPSGLNGTDAGTRILLAPIQGHIAVVDESSAPVAGAKVLIGDAVGTPFAGNLLQTDGDGKVAIPPNWSAELMLTIDAPGFVRTTYLAQAPEAKVVSIRRQPKQRLELTGQTTGFGRLSNDGTMDVSLVFPALSRQQVNALELTRLIGTDIDKRSVYGQTLEIPANLSIPAQTESIYLFVPVSLDKPSFRVFVDAAGSYRFAAVRATFDFKTTIDDLRKGHSFFDVINRLQFQSFATRDYVIQRQLQSGSIPVGEEPLQAGAAIAAPTLPKGYSILAVAMSEAQGQFVVTDVKRLLSGEHRSLMVAAKPKGANYLLRTLKKYEPSRTDFSGYDYDEMSTIFEQVGALGAVGFLPLAKPPESRARSLILTKPTDQAALSPALRPRFTRLALAKVDRVGSGGLWLMASQPLWDFYADGFVGKVDIPALGADPWASKGRYRWELVFTGSTDGSGAAPTVTAAETRFHGVSHLTRSAIDFAIP